MPEIRARSDLAPVNNAHIYYEIAGEGVPFVMIHAGVADSRQWNNEFAFFADRFRVLRYDLRGYGKSEPVDGEFNHLDDLTALLDYLQMDQPLILMGCSMGGSLAMDFALTQPFRVKALIMVGSAPSGLELDTPVPAEFEEAEKAFDSGDFDRAAEIQTHIWFDGVGRSPAQVDQAMRQLVYEMNRNAINLEARQLGKRKPNTEVPAAGRVGELKIPVLVVVGDQDGLYLQAAADYMAEKIPTARKVIIADAAHLPNLDHPGEFQRCVTEFLDAAIQ